MTHFGIICPALTGHLNPMTTLGHELQRRGHRVTLFGILDARPQTLAAGLEFWAIGEAEFPAGASAAANTKLGELSGLAAFKQIVTMFRRSKFLTKLLHRSTQAFDRSITHLAATGTNPDCPFAAFSALDSLAESSNWIFVIISG